MTINKIIAACMKEKNMTQQTMARAIHKEKATDVSARLASKNMTFAKAIEMLEVLGYEVIVQEKRQGRRADGQIVVTAEDEK